MVRDKVYDKKLPLIAQLISVLVFIGLCIFACFTAFFRNGTINISALSATLMSVFFIVFGITFGVYVGCIFFGKRKLLSIVIPALTASLTTIVMYIGELILTGGVLFKFGTGFLFEPIDIPQLQLQYGTIPFALIDLVVIVIPGNITYFVMRWINKAAKY